MSSANPMPQRRKWVIVAGVVTALIAGIFGVSSQLGSDCAAQGDNNNVSCDENAISNPAASPSVEVVPGPVPNTWSFQMRNWEANSTVQLIVIDADGVQQDLSDLATRTIEADGTADSEASFYFGEYVEGESRGRYTLRVVGNDSNGEGRERRAYFDAPSQSE